MPGKNHGVRVLTAVAVLHVVVAMVVVVSSRGFSLDGVSVGAFGVTFILRRLNEGSSGQAVCLSGQEDCDSFRSYREKKNM